MIERLNIRYPVAYAGDGFLRTLLTTAALAEAKGGVAALDEPEAFAHPRLFPALAKLFRRAVADGTQVLVATHGLELVGTLLEGFASEPELASVVGLRRDNGVVDPLVVPGADARRRVVDLGDDLRL